MFREYSVVWLNTEVLLTTGLQCFIIDCYASCWLDDSVLLLLTTNVTGTLGLRSGECGGRAVQASSSYGPWVPPTPFSPVGRCLPATGRCRVVRYKRQCLPGFCTVCWKVLVNPYPLSLHAEKCVALPLVRCWKTLVHPYPRVYMLKKSVALPLVIRRPVLQSAGTHV